MTSTCNELTILTSTGNEPRSMLSDQEFRQIWESFNKLRMEGHLCDAVIVANNVHFPVHRAVMAANSPYFRALFTNGMQETLQREVNLAMVDASVFGHLIDYVYTRSIKINEENVRQLLIHAERFLIRGLVERCSEFIVGNLSCSNCIGILSFGRQFYQSEIERCAWTFLLANFVDVTKRSHEYLEMEPFDLRDVICNDALNIRCEERLFEAIVRWIDYDHVTRMPFIADLLKHVRLGLVSSTYFIDNIAKNPYVINSGTKCSAILEVCNRVLLAPGDQTAWQLMYYVEQHGSRSCFTNDRLVRPRIPQDVLFAIGGWNGGSPIALIESYDVRANRWFSHPLLEDITPKAYHGVATIGRLIYVIGGFDGAHYYNSVKCFCPTSKTWSDVAPMYSQRCYVSTCTAHGCIYALGGFDGHFRLSSAERYNPTNNQWTQLEPMLQRRSDAGADSLHGQVYIAGGFNGEHCMSSVERFNPHTNQWTMIESMSVSRSGISLIAWEDTLYAIGGFDGERRLQTCECYIQNPNFSRWTSVGSMNTARSNFAVGVTEDVIYVIGGFSGSATISNVEWYNAERDVWVNAADMNVNRSALKACVVTGLDNVIDYTYYGHCTPDERPLVTTSSPLRTSQGKRQNMNLMAHQANSGWV